MVDRFFSDPNDYNNPQSGIYSNKIQIPKGTLNFTNDNSSKNDFILDSPHNSNSHNNITISYHASDNEEFNLPSSDSDFEKPGRRGDAQKWKRKTKRPEPVYQEEQNFVNKKQRTEKEVKEFSISREEMEKIIKTENNYISVSLECEKEKNWRFFENLV